jgi:hypothetical protein
LLIHQSRKDNKDKKRAGPEETLPSGTKKAKLPTTSVFTSKGSWGSINTHASSSNSSSEASKGHGKSNKPQTSSSSSSDASSQQEPSKPITTKLPFGFSFKPKDPSTVQPTSTPHKSSSPSPAAVTSPNSILSKPTIESTLPVRFVAEGMSVDQALENVMPKESKKQARKVETSKLVIFDSANVSHQHGGGSFSTQGLPIAVEYYKSRGFRVLAFLPDHYITHHYPDPLQDWTALEDLVKQKVLVPTPAADYDDLYIVQFARKNGGYIITNDRYRDVPLSYPDPKERANLSKWIKSHRVPFDFEGDTFVPKRTLDPVLSPDSN